MIVVKEIYKSFQSNHVLKDLNMVVKEQESICINGLNGSGKSTLLKICSGLMLPEKGEIKIFKKSFHNYKEVLEIKRRLGVLLHSNMIYPNYTVLENLTFFSRLLGIINFKDRIDAVLEELNINQFSRIEVHKLSNGNQRKVGIAKSILNDPELLIIDEPEANLDNEGSQLIVQLLLNRLDAGKSNLFTSHSELFYKKCSTKTLNLKNGRLI
tara:strand:+ start:201 stop:836 length:636 start_codon:yes stop_codon:yes gene_type:complete